MASLSSRLKELRKEHKITQPQLANKLNVGKSTVAMWETGDRQPDYEMLQKIADFFDVSIDYLLGRTDIKQSTKVTVSGKEVELSPEEYKLFEELKKHPILFHDLASDPEGKVKELLKLYKMKKILLEEDNEEYGEGFGELED